MLVQSVILVLLVANCNFNHTVNYLGILKVHNATCRS